MMGEMDGWMVILRSNICVLCVNLTFQGEQRNVTPWLLVMANTPSLVSNLLVRGPFACNAVLLTHRAVGLDDMSADLVAALGKADGLMKIYYAGTVASYVIENE